MPLMRSSKRHSLMLRDVLVTRSHKLNDRDHVALADGTSVPEDHLPRYFAKSGHVDADPKKTKKDGGGKGNWGRSGDEVNDYAYNLTNPRRRSNSSTHHPQDFKTKFEAVDPEPVFEEEIHGAPPLSTAETEHGNEHGEHDELEELEKDVSNDSASGGSVEEEASAKKA